MGKIVKALNFRSTHIKVDYLGFQCTDPKFEYIKLLTYLNRNNITVFEESYFHRKKTLLIRNSEEFCAYAVIKADIKAKLIKAGTQVYQIDFRGHSAVLMYQRLQYDQFFNSEDFYLYRLDVAYDQKSNHSDNKSFFMSCAEYAETKNRSVHLNLRPGGKGLALNNRRAQTYFRIYSKPDNLIRTEMELKKPSILNQVFEINSEHFETLVLKHFFCNLGFIVPLELPEFTWLVFKLRKIKSKPIFAGNTNTLGFNYIKFNIIIKEPQNLVNFAQLLSYTQKLNYSSNLLGDINYRKFTFRISDFVRYKNPGITRIDYEVKKLLSFFSTLQQNSLIQYFSDMKYRSLITIPIINIRKIDQHWETEIFIADNLYNYWLPYIIPDIFNSKLSKHEFDVRFKILESFLTQGIRKKLDINKFFSNYSKLSNSNKTKVKKYFINGLEKFQRHGLIENNFKILAHDVWLEKQNLIESDIKNRIYFYEKIKM
jgi:hypothetical protein